jgi:hypothetical protein
VGPRDREPVGAVAAVPTSRDGFEEFVREAEPRLRRALPAVLFETPGWPERSFEPGLPAALAALSR